MRLWTGFFFFSRFSTFIDGKRLLPPPGIPAHVHRFFTDDLPAAALQTQFGLQNARCLGGKWQAGTGSDDKWHGAAGLALSAHIQPFPSRFLFIRAAPLAPKATQLKIKRGVGSEWICGDNTPQNVIRHPIKYYVNIQSQPKYWKHTSGKEKPI